MFDTLAALNTTPVYILLALFFLAIGSLLNVIIYRLPLMLKAQCIADCQSLLNLEYTRAEAVNLFLPGSFCPACKTPIKAWHNIPLLSYFLLRGKCSSCQQPVSLRYPLVETLSCLLGLLIIFFFGFTVTAVFALLFGWILISLFFIDLEHQLLPDSLTLSLLWLGLLANTQHLFVNLPEAVWSAIGAYLFLWLFIKLFYLVTGKIGMGNGDFKLYAAFGAWFGWTLLPLILLSASFSGALCGIFYLKYQRKSRNTPIAFGPFLCLAGLIALFWGHAISNWYIYKFF